MTLQDIEVEIVKRTLDSCCTIPQRNARTLQAEIHLLNKSNVFSKDGAEPVDSVRKNSRFANTKCRPLPSKAQCARRKLEDLAGELEQAVYRNLVKSTYAIVKRLVPVQARQKDGSPTWVTMVRLQLAEMHWCRGRYRWKPNLSFPKPRNGPSLNTKLRMRSGQLHNCQMGRLVRAFGVEVLQSKKQV